MKRPTDATLSAVVALIFLVGWLGTYVALRQLGVT